MTARTLMLMVPLLAALAACSQGYTPERGGSDDSGYGGYEGGAQVPAVLPQDRDRARD